MIDWVINTYMDIDNRREHVGAKSFGLDKDRAMKHYESNKAKEKESGRYLELKCYKVKVKTKEE